MSFSSMDDWILTPHACHEFDVNQQVLWSRVVKRHRLNARKESFRRRPGFSVASSEPCTSWPLDTIALFALETVSSGVVLSRVVEVEFQ